MTNLPDAGNPSSARPVAELTGLRILVVEDSPIQAELIRHILAERGYAVTLASNGAEGLQAIHLNKPALVLSDIVMPEMDGYALCRAIKNNESLYRTPVVLLTALDEPADILRAVDAGADGYMVKQFDEELLCNYIQSLLAATSRETTTERRRGFDRRSDEIEYKGARYHITTSRRTVIRLLHSVYEGSVAQRQKILKIQDELLALNEQLEQNITELRRTQEERDKFIAHLEEANKEIESYSYSVSHDLRTPLRAIDGFSRILLEEYNDKLDSEGQRLLKVVCDNTSRMALLIDDILAFSRLGRMNAESSEVNVEGLARDVMEELEASAAGRELKLQIKTLPPTRADRAMLRRVLVNLLGNAIKFTRSKAATLIEMGARLGDKEVIYYVKDNGAGFDMQYADKLFGVFQRLHSQEEFEGTGIGLAIVKRIITKHGGRVWAEGKLNEGATIYFALPVKE